jgi:hypothetical protein
LKETVYVYTDQYRKEFHENVQRNMKQCIRQQMFYLPYIVPSLFHTGTNIESVQNPFTFHVTGIFLNYICYPLK